MKTQADRTQENKSRSDANAVSQKHVSEFDFQFSDNRPEAIAQRKLKEMANNSSQVKQLRAFQEIADNHSAQQHSIRKKENNTGLPDNLKSGIENLSGYSMDDVKVHYNSDKPAHLQAFAYTQGTNIHVASGQEKHLPHEAWHVVQQKQGRVNPTLQMQGVEINDDATLESEADVMGANALRMTGSDEVPTPETALTSTPFQLAAQKTLPADVIQCDWASDAIRDQLRGKSGHHMISKDDLWRLRGWAVVDQTEHSRKFYNKYDSKKKIQNLGYTIVPGPHHYSNNPTDQWDPSTEKVNITDENKAFLGLSTEELGRYGVSKRANTEIAQKLKPVQDILDKRRAGNARDDASWKIIWDTFEDLEGEESEYDADTVLEYNADEWIADTSRQLIEVGGNQANDVTVDGNRIKVQNGKLLINNVIQQMEGVFTEAAGKLKYEGETVSVDPNGKLLSEGKELKSWQDTKYRVREGYVMEQLAPAGQDSIFVKTAKTKRTLDHTPVSGASLDYGYKTNAGYNANNVSIKFKYEHVLNRHSFQWWAGESTNINIFFPPAMNDTQILNFCKEKIKAYVDQQIPGLTNKAEENYNVAEHKFSGGAPGDVYLDLKIDAYGLEFNENEADQVEIWGFDVEVKTVVMQSQGIQVPQKALMAMKNSGIELPVELDD